MSADFTYSQGVVIDPDTSELVTEGSGVFKDVAGGTEQAIYDLLGNPITGVAVGSLGVHSAFKADLSRGMLSFGVLDLPIVSLEAIDSGLNAAAAQASAQSALDLVRTYSGDMEKATQAAIDALAASDDAQAAAAEAIGAATSAAQPAVDAATAAAANAQAARDQVDGAVAGAVKIVPQDWTAGQQAQGRANIGAVGQGDLVVNVKDYGAKGDGTADDTAALQAAINASETTGAELLLSPGRYKVTGTLLLPTAIKIRGVARVTIGSYSADTVLHNAIIESTAATVFGPKGVAPQTTRLTLENVEFKNLTAGGSSILFSSGLTLSGSSIWRVSVLNFGTVFAAKLIGLTAVTGSFFQGVRAAFTSGDLVDSRIQGNYINGDAAGFNATGITITNGSSTTLISDNYIDFFKYGVLWGGSSANSIQITDNLFDYCYRAIAATGSVIISTLLVTANVFHNISKAMALPYFSAPDAEMSNTGVWTALDMPQGATWVRIADNLFDVCDLGINVSLWPIKYVRSSGNTYRAQNGTTGQRIAWTGLFNSGAVEEWQGIDIEELYDKSNAKVVVLASVAGINAKTVGTTTLYTAPSGKTAVITNVVVRCTAAAAIAVGPTLGIGVAAGEDDIFAPVALTGLLTNGKIWTFTSTGLQRMAVDGNVIKLGIDTAATGTSQVLSVDVIGYLIGL